MYCEIGIQTPSTSSAIINVVRKIASSRCFTDVLSMFAYASKGGAILLSNVLRQEVAGWETLRKRWLISLDYGHTDPAALEILLNLPNSEVRIPYLIDILKNKLMPIVCFHPKSMFFYTKNSNIPAVVYIGSANMTMSGLCYGHESGMAIYPRLINTKIREKNVKNTLNQIINANNFYYDCAILDAELISKYAKIRKRCRPRLEDETSVARKINYLLENDDEQISFTNAAIISTAKNFWVESGYVVKNRGPLRSGNQIDLPRGASAFFGFTIKKQKPNTFIGKIRIKIGKTKMAYRLRLGNNLMEKISLPIPEECGIESYDENVILFKKIDDYYTIEIQPQGSSKANRWGAFSEKQHSGYSMRSGRRFGVFY
jgi:HKD family nuclease